MPIIEGAIGAPLQSAGAPGVGTDEVQTIATTGTPTGGTFRLSYEGLVTSALPFDCSAAAMDTALELLPSIGSGGVTCAAGPLPTGITVTFNSQNLGRKAVPLIALHTNSLTGGTTPTVTITETTPGVDAFGRGAGKGSMVTDVTNGVLYINTGTANVPVWTKVGTQT
jgi:hypothetical protein